MFFIKSLLMLMLPFYRVDLPDLDYPPNFTYVEYSHGVVKKNLTLDENNRTYIDLKNFLSLEKAGWKYDLTNYAPYHVFNSKIININCLNDKVVINFRRDDAWVQVSKQTPSSCPTPQ
ncbi:hypothetical protein HDE78_004244 [Rhodanobacter sp. K2T2]|nr:hypothetical protein [Rhodanobacter sp. K2T2]